MIHIATSASASTDSHPVLQRIHKVESLVETLMASWLDCGQLVHGRRAHRITNRARFVVTPMCDRGKSAVGESSEAVAWDISPVGISFAHELPISCRMVAATFTQPDGSTETMLTRLSWCRFTSDQKYRSGGKFVRIIEPGIVVIG